MGLVLFCEGSLKFEISERGLGGVGGVIVFLEGIVGQ